MRTKLFTFLTLAVTVTALWISGCKKPSASFTASKSEATVGEVVTFTNTSSDAGAYIWDFGDGGTSTKMNPTHVYELAGDYTVTLTSSKTNGKKPSDAPSLTIKVKAPDAPVAAFSASKTTAMPGEVITFTNSSTKADEYVWDFGDGGSSSSPNATHVYGNGGTYTVTLTAFSNARTQKNTKTATITIGYSSGDFATEAKLIGSWKITSHSITNKVNNTDVPNCFSIQPQAYSTLFTPATTPKVTFTSIGTVNLYDNDGNLRNTGTYNVIDANRMQLNHAALNSSGGPANIANTRIPEVNFTYNNGGNWTIETLSATTLTLKFVYSISTNVTVTNNCVTPNTSLTGPQVITETVTYTKQ